MKKSRLTDEKYSKNNVFMTYAIKVVGALLMISFATAFAVAATCVIMEYPRAVNHISTIIIGDTKLELDNIDMCITEDYIEVKNNNNSYAVVHIECTESGNVYNCYIENDEYSHKVLLAEGTGEYVVSVYSMESGLTSKVYSTTINKETPTQFVGSSYNVETEKYSEEIKELIDGNGWNSTTDLATIYEYFSNYKYLYDVEDRIESGEIKVMILT